MKALKAIAMGVSALLVAATAQADVTVYLTGSTAYRSQTIAAIYNLMSANGTVNLAFVTGKTAQSANAAVLSGSVTGISGTTTVSCSWSGSAAGVLTVGATAQGSAPALTAPFIPDGTALSAGTLSTGGNSTGITDPTSTTSNTPHIPQIALSDAFQVATPFTANLILTTQDSNAYSYKMAKLTDNVVGVIPFNFFASKGSSSNLNNITPQLAQALFGPGTAPLSLFTGVAADSTTTVYATGRNPDSGTRITAFAESGVGVGTQVNQYKPTISSGAITGLALYPATTLFNVFPVLAGNNGESSGGTVAANLSATGNILVSYLGTSDSTTALKGGAVQLAYNGVTLPNSGSPNYTYSDYSLIQNGKYTFWGYEHLDYKSTLAGDAKTFATALKNNIHDVSAQLLVTSMNVGRQADGGQVTFGNPY